MAGHRRTRGQPRREHLRAQRRLARLHEKLAIASTPNERIAAAADYLRGALKHTDPALAEDLTSEAVTFLTRTGQRALTRESGAAS